MLGNSKLNLWIIDKVRWFQWEIEKLLKITQDKKRLVEHIIHGRKALKYKEN